MRSVAIIENDEYSLLQLKALLEQWSSVAGEPINLYEFHTGKEILRHYSTKRIDFDIVFVDIELDDMNGLEAMRKLRDASFDSLIVITTNHQTLNYVQQSFSLSALQYYVKPITLENIASSMQRIPDQKNVIFEYGRELKIVRCKDILYFESKKNYIIVTCSSPELAPKDFRDTIAHYIETLPPIFVQSHRSFIVNISHITKINGNIMQMRNGAALPLGKPYVDRVLLAFQRQR